MPKPRAHSRSELLRAGSCLLALCLFALWATRARAASGRIAVVAEAPGNRAVARAMLRIQGELVAEGFDVVVDTPSEDQPSPDLAVVAERNDALAAIGLSCDADAHEVELRVVDRLTSKVLMRRAPLGGAEDPQAAEVLAVRAVDLLRASLLELLTPPRVVPPPLAPELQAQRTQAASFARNALPSDVRHRFCLELGAGMLASISGVGPAVLPLVRAQYRLFEPLSLRLGVAGLGSEPRVNAMHTSASARVGQDLGELGLVLSVWSRPGLGLTSSLAGGLLYTSVDGETEWPYRARHGALWSAVLDAGVGLDLRLGSRFDLRIETHAILAEPYPVVRFMQDERAHSGLPSLLQTLTFAGWP